MADLLSLAGTPLAVMLFAVLAALFGALSWGMRGPLETPQTPLGIVALELAGTEEIARQVLSIWRRRGRLGAARRNVLLDFPFIVVYAFGLALAWLLAMRLARHCNAIGDNVIGTWTGVAQLAAFAAGALDVVEDVALLKLIKGAGGAGWPALSFGCAALKFVLLSAGILGVVGVLAYVGLYRLYVW